MTTKKTNKLTIARETLKSLKVQTHIQAGKEKGTYGSCGCTSFTKNVVQP